MKIILDDKDVIVAEYKSCRAWLVKFKNKLDIQWIESKHKNKGYASKLIKYFKDYCKLKNIRLVCSLPTTDIMHHLCNKFKLIDEIKFRLWRIQLK